MNVDIPDDERRLNLLVAYPYLNADQGELIREHGDRTRFVLDSGAFTAWRTGKPVVLDDYCRFIETTKIPIWRYFALDVIGDPDGTRRNLDTMLQRGLKPIPVFTRGEDPKHLDELYEVSDVVAVGGLVGTKGNKGFVKGIMRHVGDRKVHWLGFTSPNYVKHFRPFMCDAANWENASRFGVLRLHMGGGHYKGFQRQTFANRPPDEAIRAVRRLGYDPNVLASEKSWRGTWSPLRLLGAATAIDFVTEVQRNVGTLVFLASTMNTALLFHEYDRMYE